MGLIAVPLLLAVVYARNCGATTDYATQAGIAGHVGGMRREQDLVVVPNADRGAAPAGEGRGPGVRLRWPAADHLDVAHHSRARTFREKTELGRVHVSYVPLP